MPTYGYTCKNCGHEFEQFQSITDKPRRTCPSCGKRTLKRLIGVGAGIIFKGSGFYQTDYRSESYKKAENKEKGSGTEKTPTPDAAKPTSGDKTQPTPKKKSA